MYTFNIDYKVEKNNLFVMVKNVAFTGRGGDGSNESGDRTGKFKRD